MKSLVSVLDLSIAVQNLGKLFMNCVCNIWQWFSPSIDMLGVVVGMMISMLALALPIAQGTISDRLEKYNNKHILKMFKEERCYKAQLFMIVLLVICLILTFFFSGECSSTIAGKVIGLIVLILGIISIGIFCFFFKRSYEYTINTDEVVLKFCEQKLLNMNYDTSNHTEHFELIEMCGKVIEQKIHTGNASSIDRVSKIMEDAIIRVIDSVKIRTQEQNNAIYDLCRRYYVIMFKLWNTCYRVSDDIAYQLVVSYNRVLKHALNKNVSDYNSFQPLLFFYQRIASEIEARDKKVPYASSSPCMWYFDIVFDDTFNLRHLQQVNVFLLSIMQKIIDNEAKHVFLGLISHIIDGWYGKNELPLQYSDDEDYRKISNIRLQYVSNISRHDLAITMNEVRKLDRERYDIYKIKNIVVRQYKYNNLQLVTMIMGSYCLFMKKYALLREMLQYNQPSDSEASFGNIDIIPNDINKLLDLYLHSFNYIQPYSFSWPEHHDTGNSFKRFIILLMYWSAINEDVGEIDIPTRGVNKQFYENFWHSLGHLSDKVEYSVNEVKNVLNLENIEGAKESIISTIEDAQKRIEVLQNDISKNQSLDNDKVQKFKTSIISELDGSIWKRCFEFCRHDLVDTRSFSINMKRRMDKSFLSTGDDGFYMGFTYIFSETIMDDIDYKIERVIKAQSKLYPFSQIPISKYDYKEKLLEFKDEMIIMFINYYGLYELLCQDKGFTWDKTGKSCGETSNGATILSYGDRYQNSKRIIALRRSDFSKLNVALSPDNIEVADLNTDDVKRQEIINMYGDTISEDQKMRFSEELKKAALFDIKGEFSFHIEPSAEILYLENI